MRELIRDERGVTFSTMRISAPRGGWVSITRAGTGACFAALLLSSCGSSMERPRESLDTELDRRALEALPCASWTDRDGDSVSGIVRHDRERASPGLNLYASLARTSAILMDMDGTVVHRWSRASGKEWGHVELLPNRELLVLNEVPFKLLRLDWDSSVIWENDEQVHHDLDISDNGDIYVLTGSKKHIDFGGGELPIYDHAFAIPDSAGQLKRRISFSSVLAGVIDEPSLREFVAPGEKVGERYRLVGKFVDLFHVNTLAIVPRTFSESFQKGFVLFAARNLNLIGVVDVDSETLVWSWGTDELDWPHQPTLLESGNLLIFDNGFHRGYSRIVEVVPSSGDIVWEYKGDPPKSFRSITMGGVQGLPNGNVLVTESLRGHAFEITRDGEIVWEFFNPDVDVEKDKRATLYRVERVPLDYLER